MGEQKFFRCKHCGNFVGLINNAGVPMVCCGENMEELIPNTVEASKEKHIPACIVLDDAITVQIGSTLHPMEDNHHIEFIYICTERGGQRKSLKVGEPPIQTFKLVDDTAKEIFAYCNIHGLWKVKP